jgi:uncharacterized protein
MTVSAELLELLVCPNDRGEIDYNEAEQVIVCRTCGYRYPVRDDIPIMLIDEAEKPDTPAAKRPAQKPAQRPAQKPAQKPAKRPSRKPRSGT